MAWAYLLFGEWESRIACARLQVTRQGLRMDALTSDFMALRERHPRVTG
jgi:hypothetical protein